MGRTGSFGFMPNKLFTTTKKQTLKTMADNVVGLDFVMRVTQFRIACANLLIQADSIH